MFKTNLFYRFRKIILFFFSRKIENIPGVEYDIILGKQKIILNSGVEKVLKQSQNTKKINDQLFETPEGQVTLVNNIILHGNSGLISFKGKYIVESALSFNRLLKIRSAIRDLFYSLFKSKKIDNNEFYTSIIHLPWGESSNYHWFIDCLSRIYLLQSYRERKLNIYVHESIKKFQIETLRFCIPENWTIQTLPKKKNIKIHNFYFLNFQSKENSGYLHPKIVDFLKTKIFEGYSLENNSYKSKKKKNRIYISRKNAQIRRIFNEKDFCIFLNKFEFTTYYAEQLSYAEQVKLFKNAEIIISPHGAGLTNFLFSSSPLIIEIHPEHRVKSHYAMLSLSVNSKYFSVLAPVKNRKNDEMYLTSKEFDLIEKIIKTNHG